MNRCSDQFAYAFVDGPDGLGEVARLAEQADRVALDLETTGLSAVIDRPRLLQLGFPSGDVRVVDLFATGGLGPLADTLRRACVVGHNVGFDLGFLRHHFDVEPRRALDTMLASRVLDCGRRRPPGYHGLAEVAARTLRVRLSKEEQRSDWSGALSREQIEYAARDVAVLLPLWDRLEQGVRELGLLGTLSLELDVLPAVVAMSLAGVRVNRKAWQAAVDRRVEAAKEAKEEASVLLEGANLRSPQQVLRALRDRLGIDLDSTSKEALAPFRGDEAVDNLLAFRAQESFPSGLGAGILQALDASDDRVRGSFNQLAAPTGRMSCREPNLLATPKDADIRKCFVPADGHVFILADYGQIELRIAADLVGEARLIEVFRDPEGDPHRLTAGKMLRKSPAFVTKNERTAAKPVNFGLLYGMSPEGLVDYARRPPYGVVLSLRQARSYHRGFFAGYPAIRRWHERTWVEVQRRRGCLDVQTVGGRIRSLAPAVDRSAGARAWRRALRAVWRHALNTPIQGTGADGLKRAIVALHPRVAALGGRLILPVHDELVIEVPADRSAEAVEVVAEGMREGMAGYLTTVPALVKPSAGNSWADK